MPQLWKAIAKGLMHTAKAVEATALWCSEHPEVVAIAAKGVAVATGHPEAATTIDAMTRR